MPALPIPLDPTLEAMHNAYAAQQEDRPRGHLGASQIGHPCRRKLWYGFRWATWPTFPAATLYKFDDGHRSEDIVAARLRLVPGIDLRTEDEEGNQFRFTEHGGHFAGSVDGLIKGLKQAPKTVHVWEHKCVGDKVFAEFRRCIHKEGEKHALKAWNPTYYAQAQTYMRAFNLTRHYLTVASAGSRDIASCRTEYDEGHAEAMSAKAAQVITSDTPPVKMSETGAHHMCKWCDHKEVCHYDMPAGSNCRTCKHGKPIDGGWHCSHYNNQLSLEEQFKGYECPYHRPIPGVVVEP